MGLDQVRQMVEEGNLQPIEQRVFHMDQAKMAFQILSDGQGRGKMVVRMENFRKVCPVLQHTMCD